MSISSSLHGEWIYDYLLPQSNWRVHLWLYSSSVCLESASISFLSLIRECIYVYILPHSAWRMHICIYSSSVCLKCAYMYIFSSVFLKSAYMYIFFLSLLGDHIYVYLLPQSAWQVHISFLSLLLIHHSWLWKLIYVSIVENACQPCYFIPFYGPPSAVEMFIIGDMTCSQLVYHLSLYQSSTLISSS